MEKLQHFLEELNLDEVQRLERDLTKKQSKIKELVQERAQYLKEHETHTCVTCGSAVSESKRQHFELVFGPSELRKRGIFCGLDCLEYFVSKLSDYAEKHRKSLKT